jgi:hypothetical protein
LVVIDALVCSDADDGLDAGEQVGTPGRAESGGGPAGLLTITDLR